MRLPRAPRVCQRGVRAYRAVYSTRDTGTVEAVLGPSLRLAGLRGARHAAAVVFRGGAVAVVTDLWRDGIVHAVLVSGRVEPHEAAVLAPSPLHVVAGPGLRGRVVDPLGRPLDGRGPIDHAAGVPWRAPLDDGVWLDARARAQPLLVDVASPGVADRGPVVAALPTGVVALDAFSPLLRGGCTAILGPAGAGKTTLALDVVHAVADVNAARARRRAAGAGDGLDADAAPVHCIYVAIGASVGAIRASVRALRASDAMEFATVVAAPYGPPAATGGRDGDGGPLRPAVGAAYLAPYAGAAIGAYWAARGRHALVVYDDLSAHAHAARV